MRVLIAPDSFKECMPAHLVAQAIAKGWQRGAPGDVLTEMPLADGGEGTTLALTKARGGSLHETVVTGPLGAEVTATYGMIDGGATAIVEVAEASGLHLVPEQQRSATKTTSFGTGQLILAALQHRPTTLIISLGGSATTDAGAGILQALGGLLQDRHGADIPLGGQGLRSLSHLDLTPLKERLRGIRVIVATDVTNPLLGANGAAAVFGPQKGASDEDVVLLDENLRHFSTCAGQHGFDVSSFPGSGAAGGIGGTLAGMLGGEIRSGIDLVIDAVGLADLMDNADIVVTAEGSMDGQSAAGKAPAGVARLAQKRGLPVIGLAGMMGTDLTELHQQGLTAGFSIVTGPMTKAAAIGNAARYLEATAEQLARLVTSLAKTIAVAGTKV